MFRRYRYSPSIEKARRLGGPGYRGVYDKRTSITFEKFILCFIAAAQFFVTATQVWCFLVERELSA